MKIAAGSPGASAASDPGKATDSAWPAAKHMTAAAGAHPPVTGQRRQRRGV